MTQPEKKTAKPAPVKIKKSELGARVDWKLVREINAAPCPPLLCAHKIGRTVRGNLPLNDPKTDHDESEEPLLWIYHIIIVEHSVEFKCFPKVPI